jgi:hypothetical protein
LFFSVRRNLFVGKLIRFELIGQNFGVGINSVSGASSNFRIKGGFFADFINKKLRLTNTRINFETWNQFRPRKEGTLISRVSRCNARPVTAANSKKLSTTKVSPLTPTQSLVITQKLAMAPGTPTPKSCTSKIQAKGSKFWETMSARPRSYSGSELDIAPIEF